MTFDRVFCGIVWGLVEAIVSRILELQVQIWLGV